MGRADSNLQVFHHLKLKLSDGTIDSAHYKLVTTTSLTYRLINSDKNTNGAYIWSCGLVTTSPAKAIYSVLASGNLDTA